MQAATGAETVAHPADAGELPVKVTTLVRNGDTVPVGSARLSVIHLRGHTPGSIALGYDAAGALAAQPQLFTGDSLFPGGPGNTEGDPQRFGQLMDDLEDRVFGPLPDGTWVYPGHGRMERQWRTMGGAYDWSKEVATCLPEYYRWNQWLFLQFFKHGLAYRQKAPVNWCPNHGVLANEQVHNGRCWRCDAPVSKRDLEQWFFRITKYADDLLDFSEIDWPERIVSMQTNWIGRSEGVEFDLPVDGHAGPEDLGLHHARRHRVRHDLRRAGARASAGRAADHARAPGRGRGVRRAHAPAPPTSSACRPSATRPACRSAASRSIPANGERLPIWIADYVLAPVRHGRDHGRAGLGRTRLGVCPQASICRSASSSARQMRRTTSPPISCPGNTAYVDPGVMVNSGQFNGLPNEEAWERIADWFEERGIGRRRVNYRMRDWLVSRQRYWGTPIPIVYCPTDGIVPVPEDQLPVRLPEDVEFQASPDAEGNPLAASASFVNTTCPICGGPARRETDTMDTLHGFVVVLPALRLAATTTTAPFDPDSVRTTGCRSTSTWAAPSTRSCTCCTAASSRACCSDLGLVDFREPFKRLFNQGEVLGPDGKRMSKSHGNVVNPDEHVERSGADAVRGWLAFLGPWDQGGPINESALGAIHDLLRDIWNLAPAPAPDVRPRARPTQTCGGRCTPRSRASARTSKASASTR